MAIDLERSSQLHPTGTLGMRQGWCSLKKNTPEVDHGHYR